jgi:hypothetical protein
MDLSKYIFNKSIDLLDKIDKKGKNKKNDDDDNDINDNDINDINDINDNDINDNNKEKKIINIFYIIYDLKITTKLGKLNYYFENNYIDKNVLINTLNEIEIKLKSKINFIGSDLYNYIDDYIHDYNHEYNYKDTDKTSIKKYEDVFDYIPELIEETDEEYNSDEDEYKTIKKSYTRYNAIPKQNFVKYLFEMCPNREQINSNNIKNFVKLENIEDFIQFDESVKNLLKEVYDNKILSLNNYEKFSDSDIKMLLKLNFDKITMRNAILKMNINLIEILLNNKYCASQNDLLNIRCKICDKNNKSKYDYDHPYNNFIQFESIKEILDVFATYNIYMDKDVLNKFCVQNDFHPKFDYLNLQPYTIYKDDLEKEFKKIINEITQKLGKLSNISDKFSNICDIQSYIDEKQKSSKTIDKDDLYNLADYKMKFLLDEYFKQIIESKQIESKQIESKQIESKQIESKQIESKQIESKQNKSDEKKMKKVIVKKIVKKVVKKE